MHNYFIYNKKEELLSETVGSGTFKSQFIFSEALLCRRYNGLVGFLLTVPRRFLCWSFSLFVRWLLCLCLFLIYLSFRGSRRLCFSTVAFPGYLRTYFCVCDPNENNQLYRVIALILVNIVPSWDIEGRELAPSISQQGTIFTNISITTLLLYSYKYLFRFPGF